MLLACLAAEAVALFLLAGQAGGTTLLIAGALAGLGAGPLGPLVNTVLLRRTPSAIRGRVLGASTAVALTATPLAVLLAGGVIEILGTRSLLLGGAVLFAGLAGLSAVLPSLRQLDREPNLGGTNRPARRTGPLAGADPGRRSGQADGAPSGRGAGEGGAARGVAELMVRRAR